MKTSNIQTTHSMAIIRGWVQRGVTLHDATTSTDTILDLTVVGGTITDNGDGTAVLTIGGTTGTGNYPSFPVTTFGAVGDGTADDTAAINAAIDALNTAGCGVLYFPCGTYLVASSLDAITAPCLVMGDGPRTGAGDPISQINFSSTSTSLFDVSANGCLFRDLSMVQTGGTATAGSAIESTGGAGAVFEHLYIANFFTGVDLENSLVWKARAVFVENVRKYGFRIRNTAVPDAGDYTISDCIFSNAVAADAAVRIETSGGAKILNCKVNGGTGTSNFDYGIDLAVATSVDTSILLVSNCSIENVSEGGIRGTTSAATSKWGNIVIGNCQFLILGNSAKAISLVGTTAGDFYNVVIHGCVMSTAGTARSAMTFTKCDNVTIDNVILAGFDDYATLSTTTNVQGIYVDFTPTLTADSGDPSLGTGGTATGRYIKQGDHVHARGTITFGSASATAGNGQYEFAFPVTAAASANGAMGSAVLYDSSAGLFNLGVVYTLDTGEFRIAVGSTGLVVTNTVPWVWANNDLIFFELRYEAA